MNMPKPTYCDPLRFRPRPPNTTKTPSNVRSPHPAPQPCAPVLTACPVGNRQRGQDPMHRELIAAPANRLVRLLPIVPTRVSHPCPRMHTVASIQRHEDPMQREKPSSGPAAIPGGSRHRGKDLMRRERIAAPAARLVRFLPVVPTRVSHPCPRMHTVASIQHHEDPMQREKPSSSPAAMCAGIDRLSWGKPVSRRRPHAP